MKKSTMDKQGPIKRHKGLIPFSQDHHWGLLLVWKIRQGLNKGIATNRISDYVLYFFEQDLRQHFYEEETSLFTLLPADDPLRRQAETDHENIRAVVNAIEAGRTDSDTLGRFADMLQAHIRFEERVLFNHLQQLMPEKFSVPDQEENAGRKDIDAEWKDVFWTNENNSL